MRVVSSATRVDPGDRISRGKRTGIFEIEHGTAGVLVARNSDGARGFLTCAHVLKGNDPAPNMNPVYAPEYKHCGDSDCNDPIGTVDTATLFAPPPPTPAGLAPSIFRISGIDFVTDTSVVLLDKDIVAKNEVPKIGHITGVRDLITENLPLFPKPATPGGFSVEPDDQPDKDVAANLPQELTLPTPIPVRKYGATTKFTTGVVRRFVRSPTVGKNPWAAGWVIAIDTDPGQNEFDDTYDVDLERHKAVDNLDTTALVADALSISPTPGNPNPTPAITKATAKNDKQITVKGRYFSDSGDSGSALVDGAGKLIGIVRGSDVFSANLFVPGQPDPITITTGHSQAVFIAAAFGQLGYGLLPAAKETSGAHVVVPGLAVATERPRIPFDQAAIDRAHAQLASTPRGARLIAIASRHFDEVRRLIHHRRHCTVVWHRNKGPAFVAALMRSSREPSWPIPAAIDDCELGTALRAVRDVLSLEGSADLQDALRTAETEILALVGLPSIDAVLARFAEPA